MVVKISSCLPAPGDIRGALAEVPGVCRSFSAPWAPEVIQLGHRARGQEGGTSEFLVAGMEPKLLEGMGPSLSLAWSSRSMGGDQVLAVPSHWAPHIGPSSLASRPGVFSVSAGVVGVWAGARGPWERMALGVVSVAEHQQGCGSDLGFSRPWAQDMSRYG